MKLLLRLKDFRFQRYESGTQELIGPSSEMTASKLKYFNSRRKMRRCKRVARENVASLAATRICMLTFMGFGRSKK